MADSNDAAEIITVGLKETRADRRQENERGKQKKNTNIGNKFSFTSPVTKQRNRAAKRRSI